MRKTLHRTQTGDTIVEVLISIAILGFILASSYALSTRNQLSALKTQERAEATSIANTQLESLRAYLETRLISTIASPTFCLTRDTAGNVGVVVPSGPGSTPDPSITADLLINYDNQCEQNYFRFSIWKPGPVAGIDATDVGAQASSGAFAVTVRWERAGGGQDEG